MADLKEFVKRTIDEVVKRDYSHVRVPCIVLAVVTRAEAMPQGGKYRLRILDQNGQTNENIPELPDVLSSIRLEKGDKVCAALLYGQLQPYIVGRYEG